MNKKILKNRIEGIYNNNQFYCLMNYVFKFKSTNVHKLSSES